MNKYATREHLIRVLAWLVWFIILLTVVDATANNVTTPTTTPMLGIVSHDPAKLGLRLV